MGALYSGEKIGKCMFWTLIWLKFGCFEGFRTNFIEEGQPKHAQNFAPPPPSRGTRGVSTPACGCLRVPLRVFRSLCA